MYRLLFFPIFLTINQAFCQRYQDAEVAKNMDYMQFAHKINCDSTSGSNLEHKICLNLQFQKVDSVMNKMLDYILEHTNVAKDSLLNAQFIWIKVRRATCTTEVTDLTGHSQGITYLDCMILETNKRITKISEIK